MIRRTAIVLAIAGATMSTSANAQFANRLQSLASGQSDSAPAASAGVPDEAAQESLVRAYVASQSRSLEAQQSFALALGLAEDAQKLEAERTALTSGSVNADAVRKTRTVSESAQAAIDAKMAEQPELDAGAKQHYASGLVSLLASVVEGRKLVGEANTFATGLQSMGAMQMATAGRKLAAGAFVAKESPGYLRGLYDNSRRAVTFGRSKGVNIPSNADSLLDSLD